MLLTIRQLDQELRELATAHIQLNSYYFGEILDIQEAYALTNCTLFANADNATIEESFVNIDLQLMVLDKQNTGKNNLLDIESDTLQILNDIYHMIQYSTRWQDMVKVTETSNVTKLYEHTDSIMCGWVMTLRIKIKTNKGICDTAFLNYNDGSN